MTLREIIEVLQAAERGEPIQACDTFNLGSGWFDVDPPLEPPLWNFSRYALRVKPREPRMVWVNEYGGGLAGAFFTKREADENATVNRIRCTRFVEALDYES